MKWRLSLAALIIQACVLAPVQAQTIHLFVAASMTDVCRELLTRFADTHPAAVVRPNFAASGNLARQIEQGAPADIYVSANPEWMQYLKGRQLIAPGTDRIFAHNRLVFVGEKRTTGLSLAGLVGLERIALGSPQSVPAGQYARQAMDRAGIFTLLERQRKLVMAKDVRQALLYADRGEVDGAFVYRTDAMLAIHAEILFTVPGDLYDRVAYPLALTPAGAEKESARAFYDYLSSPEAKTVLLQYGFEPIP